MQPKPLFYIQREGTEAGPYDLVQMAGLLRKKIISGETQTRLDGEYAWMPLSWQPQFSVIREMPADAISRRIDELEEEAADRKRPPIPLPSAETVVQRVGLAIGCLLLGLGAYGLARFDETLGTILLYLGGGIAIAAHCLVLVKVFDESWPTLLLVFFVPGGDAYYYVSRFEQNFKLYCVKYAAASVALGAALGLGQR